VARVLLAFLFLLFPGALFPVYVLASLRVHHVDPLSGSLASIQLSGYKTLSNDPSAEESMGYSIEKH
ncbi:hypothetical protein LJC40_06330, partial [Synergistaceae bacterium OttesenSCG-928-D05]|nr:hypothetical protein [Synergistaceae bacterium OttesenSCG-928-D05]